ncbi:MAG TPA: hypothetical protein VLC46_17375 [Thermoanaerobaculia bacterium]|jgi:hypothetical protein|nr:hypothetical protein [Thermoanaerobaculia bacterium]
MSVTSIQFVGLFVVMMNSGAGLHILLPHFPDSPYADHVSVIQYDPAQVSSLTWPGVTTCGPSGSLRCAPIDVETITFSGATDPSPSDIIGAIPHLQCCCPSMTDILSTYKDPNATGKLSAHIFVTQGVAEAITNSDGRTDTWVTMHSSDPAGITLTANAGTTGAVNIVFVPGAQFSILNSAISTETTPPHFLAYYLMGVGSSDCTAVPSDGPPCAASTGCTPAKKKSVKTAKPSVSTKPSVNAAKPSASTKPVVKAAKPSVNTKQPPIPTSIRDLGVDCSNSHFP